MLRQQVSESLPGRIHYHELGRFALSEISKSCDIFQYLRQLRKAEGGLSSMHTAQAGDLVEHLGH